MQTEENDLIDLHIHSIYSDGTYSVSEILEKAQNLKLKMISITDHNTVSAYGELEKINAEKYFKGKIITGAEITTTFENEIIEILAYKIETSLFEQLLAENMLSKRDKNLKKYKVSCMTIRTLQNLGVVFQEDFEEKIYENAKTFYNNETETVMDAILNEIKGYPEKNAKLFGRKRKFKIIANKRVCA